MKPELKQSLALVGPTASGKSTLAQSLAEASGAEILNCDSVQVYRGFEIGCAKPTTAERDRVVHHGLDLADPTEPYTVADFVAHGRAVLADAASRNVPVIICGGTGLYLRALRFGLMDAPSDPVLRDTLAALSPQALWDELNRADPQSAEHYRDLNPHRLIRAVEILRLTGTAPSALREQHGFREEQVRLEVHVLHLETEVLRARIQTRFDRMLADGLVDEVGRLLADGVPEECKPMQSVGYREAGQLRTGTCNEEQAKAEAFKRTWAYARRQRTWFRKEPGARWADADEIKEHAMRWLDTNRTMQSGNPG